MRVSLLVLQCQIHLIEIKPLVVFVLPTEAADLVESMGATADLVTRDKLDQPVSVCLSACLGAEDLESHPDDRIVQIQVRSAGGGVPGAVRCLHWAA